MGVESKLLEIADILTHGRKKENFVGHPFALDYSIAKILVSDAWKHQVKGIPQGAFMLAYYDGEEDVEEAILLRALGPTTLPTDSAVISSMIEYYKDNMNITGRAGSSKESKLDEFTRYEFSFSGLECRVLGVFYRKARVEGSEKTVIEFGADLENFYSANNYSVYKVNEQVLEAIVNQRDNDRHELPGASFRIGKVRYSSSRRFQEMEADVQVLVSPDDFLGKRTALFGMTRTGKSNTVKKIIQATVQISDKARETVLPDEETEDLSTLSDAGYPIYPVGQIIFDVNGEYANPNMQDEHTAIYELYSERVERYSVVSKPGFKVMKVNFYTETLSGFELIQRYFQEKNLTGDYVTNFLAANLEEPETDNPYGSEATRFARVKAAYLCCLSKAGFRSPVGFKVRFTGRREINKSIREDQDIDPSRGISLDEAVDWFTWVWKNYESNSIFEDYRKEKGREWADDDLKAMLVFLCRTKRPGGNPNISGYSKLRNRELHDLHTTESEASFESEILKYLRSNGIVIVDLSQGPPTVQKLYSEKICSRIFHDAMKRFVDNMPNNFIQFYFEEAHNLFPKKDDKDLSQIYNRIAKEGAKLNLGLTYATQEVSSISANILKNTQNWFIAHLNNTDETRELKKYYDFSDFTDSLVRFSALNDKGFVRMKTNSNPFVVPVQIDRFLSEREE